MKTTETSRNYLFATIAKKVEAYSKAHPEANIIRLGIGDVTRPLASAIIDAMHKAVDEMGKAETFRGYGPNRAMTSSARPSSTVTIKHGASTSILTKSSSVTVPRPTSPASRKSSATTSNSP